MKLVIKLFSEEFIHTYKSIDHDNRNNKDIRMNIIIVFIWLSHGQFFFKK